MGVFDFLKRKAAPIKSPVQISVERGLLTWDGQNQAEIVKDSYMGNDLVYSIITLITQKAKVAPWGVYKIKNKDAAKRYKAMLMDREPDMRKLYELKEQALEPYKDVRLEEMLKYLLRIWCKGNALEDARKCQWYLARLIAKLEG